MAGHLQHALSEKKQAMEGSRGHALAILRLQAVKERTGLSRSTLYAKVARSEFPAPIQLGENARAVGWLCHEVTAWLQQQIDNSRRA